MPAEQSSAGTGSTRSVRYRREAIRREVAANGFSRIEDLADKHAVSTMTIHRDLDELARQGWLQKIRGGATAVPSSTFHGDVHHRADAMSDAKVQLAAAAAELIPTGAAVMLDDSTTGLALAELLPSRGPLTVITNFLSIITRLAGEPAIDVIALGGTYVPAYDAFLGIYTTEAISPLRADVLVMSTTAVHNGHCYHQSQETVAVERAMIEASERRVLLLDHTKFERRGVHLLAPVSAFTDVIVDAETDPATVAELREQGATVTVADAAGDQSSPERLAQIRHPAGSSPNNVTSTTVMTTAAGSNS